MSLRRVVMPLAVAVLLVGCGGSGEADPETSAPASPPDPAYAEAVWCTDQSSTALREGLLAVLGEGSEEALSAAMAPYWEAAHATTDGNFGDAALAAAGHVGQTISGELTARGAFENLAEICGATTQLAREDLTELVDEHIGLLVEASARTDTAPYLRFEGPDGALAGEAAGATLTGEEQQEVIDEIFGPTDDQPRTRAEEMEANPPPAAVADCLDGVWAALEEVPDWRVTPELIATAAAKFGEEHPTVTALHAILTNDGGSASMVGVNNACHDAAG